MEEDIVHLVSVSPQKSAVCTLGSEFSMFLMPAGVSCIVTYLYSTFKLFY